MRPPLLTLLAALFLSSAPTADAQIGRLLDRARDRVQEAVSDRTDEARASVERAADRPPAGSTATAVDWGALLDTPFYPDRGVFNFESIMILFPPPGLTERDEVRGAYYVRTGSGSVVSRRTIRGTSDDEYDRVSPDVMAWLITQSGVTGDRDGDLEPGVAYTLDVDLYGDRIGSVPFTVQRASNGDPYNPVTETALIGPWQTHGYFSHATDRPDQQLQFHTWIGSDEGIAFTEVSIRRNGQEVAWGKNGSVERGSGVTRTHTGYRLLTAGSRAANAGFRQEGRNVELWTIQDVTPGRYEIVLSTEAGPFRTMTVEATDGAFVPHPRSAIDYEPRDRFLTPRRPADTLYWVAPMD